MLIIAVSEDQFSSVQSLSRVRLFATSWTAAAKLLQSCPTLYDPRDGSPSGSPVPGILQARTLERVAISFSNPWKRKVKMKSFSRVRLLATPWTAAYQAHPSMRFSRQEYWSGVPLPSQKILWQMRKLWKNLKELNTSCCIYNSWFNGKWSLIKA